MITYKKSGVDVDAGNELVRRIKKMAPLIGGFSDGMALPQGIKKPILIGCTDGVGTKLAIALFKWLSPSITCSLTSFSL